MGTESAGPASTIAGQSDRGTGSAGSGITPDGADSVGEATGPAGAPADSAGAYSGSGAGEGGPALVGGVESVGLADGQADQLRAEAAAAAAGAPAELSAALEGQIGGQLSQLTSWSQLTGDGVDIVAVCLLPQWHLSDGERKRVAEKLARLLDLTVPVHFSPVAEAVIGLTLCGGAICASRMLQNGGRLPPFGPPRPAAEPAPGAPAPAREPEPLRPENLTSLGI